MAHQYNYDNSTNPLIVLVELSNALKSSIPSIKSMAGLSLEEIAKEDMNRDLILNMLNHILSTCEKIDEVTDAVYPYLEEVLSSDK